MRLAIKGLVKETMIRDVMYVKYVIVISSKFLLAIVIKFQIYYTKSKHVRSIEDILPSHTSFLLLTHYGSRHVDGAC